MKHLLHSPAAVQRQRQINRHTEDHELVATNSICMSVDDHLESAVSVSLNEQQPSNGQLWDLKTTKKKIQFGGHQGIISAVKLNSRFVVSGGIDQTLRVCDAKTGHIIRVFHGHVGEIGCIHMDSSGYIVSGSQDTSIRASLFV